MVLYHGETSLLVTAYCRICGVGFFFGFFFLGVTEAGLKA